MERVVILGVPVDPVTQISGVTLPTPPTEGGFIPPNVGAPLTDDFGSRLGYCKRGFQSQNTAATIALAVVFAGPDRVYNTTCAQALGGTRAGDDYVTTYSAVALNAAQSDTTIASVPNQAALNLIPTAENDIWTPAILPVIKEEGVKVVVYTGYGDGSLKPALFDELKTAGITIIYRDINPTPENSRRSAFGARKSLGTA